MSTFYTFLQLGFSHITDIYGFDHILFILALCSVYLLSDWKEVLILVTAFTIGHSVTLALATLNIVRVDTQWVEFFIPVTIALTSIYNLTYNFKRKIFERSSKPLWPRYTMAVVFGLVHGLGFSNYLRSLLGKSNSIFQELLAFNIGLELGQILIVIIFLLLGYLVVKFAGLGRNKWNWIVSGIILGMAVMMALGKYQEIA